jgi:uncharacterized repeat protein (TIGR01451 family)/LPXTG-motif cell wall-anchored protein
MSNIYKYALSVSTAAVVAGTALVPVSVQAWGNAGANRRTYTIAEINSGILGDNIVFNSIKDSNENLSEENQNAGVIMPLTDERNFVGARDKATGNNGKNNVWDGNEIIVEEGKTYIVRLYVHNNNPKGEAAMAENVKVSFQIPEMISATPRINGYIDAPGTAIASYWDYVDFKSADGRAFYLDYVEGSALLESNYYGANGGKTVSDAIVSGNGVKVSYKANEDGKVPGCYGFASYYTIEVKPVFESSSIKKTVRKEGGEWKESVDAEIGDTVEFQIHYENLNASTVSNVMIRDSLPDNLEYVKGSAKLLNASHPNGLDYNDPTVAAVNVGNYKVGGDAYLRFKAKVVDNDLVCNKTNRLINWAKASANGYAVQDSAQVYVVKTCTTPTPDPIPEPEPEPEPTPEELPNTGATSIAGAALGAGSVVTALGYYIVSRKKLM